MIYRMTERMFSELIGAEKHAKQTPENFRKIITYINQTFGLNQEITELRLI